MPVIDFFIDRGQGPSFDFPFEIIDVGPDAARRLLDPEMADLAIELAESMDGEIIVYAPCPLDPAAL